MVPQLRQLLRGAMARSRKRGRRRKRTDLGPRILAVTPMKVEKQKIGPQIAVGKETINTNESDRTFAINFGSF